MLPLRHIIERNGVSVHFYADDTQIFLAVRSTRLFMLSAFVSAFVLLETGCHKAKVFLSWTKLKQILVTGSQHVAKQILPSAGFILEFIKSDATNLGILFQSNFSFGQHTTKLEKLCFNHLRSVSKRWQILTSKGTEKILHSLTHRSRITCLNQKPICFRM